jgi:hypothetical protein
VGSGKKTANVAVVTLIDQWARRLQQPLTRPDEKASCSSRMRIHPHLAPSPTTEATRKASRRTGSKRTSTNSIASFPWPVEFLLIIFPSPCGERTSGVRSLFQLTRTITAALLACLLASWNISRGWMACSVNYIDPVISYYTCSLPPSSLLSLLYVYRMVGCRVFFFHPNTQ